MAAKHCLSAQESVDVVMPVFCALQCVAVKELHVLPLLEDEPFRLVVQNGLSESTDYAAVQDC